MQIIFIITFFLIHAPGYLDCMEAEKGNAIQTQGLALISLEVPGGCFGNFANLSANFVTTSL